MTTTRLDSSHPSSTRIAPDRRLGAVASILGGLCLLTGFLIVPGPDVADVHAGGWVPGHALHVAGFLLMALGLPAVVASLGSRLGVAGWVGYVAVMARYVLSTGSHLYSLLILPSLAKHPELHSQLTSGRRLASIYAGHGDAISGIVSVGMLGLAYALVRCGRGLRVISGLVGLAAVAEFLGTPFGLMLLAVVGIWLGTRLLLRGDVTIPLRAIHVRASE